MRIAALCLLGATASAVSVPPRALQAIESTFPGTDPVSPVPVVHGESRVSFPDLVFLFPPPLP